jgi:NADP-dependent 3-hydroxy acid dehydrogenase YdfG
LIESHDNRSARKRIEEKGVTLVSNNIEGKVVIINNAGLMPQSRLELRKIDEWNRMIDVNIKGVLYGIAAALPHMQKQKSGHIEF